MNPDVIYIPGYYGEVGVIAKQAQQLGMKAPLLGGDGWDATQLWELAAARLTGTSYRTIIRLTIRRRQSRSSWPTTKHVMELLRTRWAPLL